MCLVLPVVGVLEGGDRVTLCLLLGVLCPMLVHAGWVRCVTQECLGWFTRLHQVCGCGLGYLMVGGGFLGGSVGQGFVRMGQGVCLTVVLQACHLCQRTGV